MALPKLDTPIYETKLISDGKIVRFRPFLVKEQKLFLMANESEDPKDGINAIKQVLHNCILNEDVDIDSLPTFDLEYLFLQLRARSVGEISNLRYSCNNTVLDENGKDKICGGVVKIDLNLLDIKPELNPEHSNKIELTDKMGIVMKYPNFNILKKLDINNQADLLNVVAGCIDYVYDSDNVYYAKDSTKEELNEFVESLSQTDFLKIQKFFQTMPKLSKDVNFKCSKCKYEEKITLEGLMSFFG